jgi:glycosyltransferase involved in cell wall biosynthesis
MTIALHIIAKKNEEDLKRIIRDYGKYFDQIDIAIDQDLDCKIYGANVYKYEWDEKEKNRNYPSFDKKRNFLVSKCTCDYYLRLDTDDELPEPEKIKGLVDKMAKTKVDVLAVYYDYAKDKYGNSHASHYRETIIANNGKYHWNKAIHENIIPNEGGKPNIAIEKNFKIIHLVDKEHFAESQERNLKFLFEEYEETKDNPDPRTLAYLGRSLYPLGYLNEAKKFLEMHIKMSGWDEDRYMSWVLLADVYNDLKKPDTAIGCCQEALHERPDFPEAYLKLHELYYQQKQWNKAIHWGKLGMATKRPDSFTLIDESAYTWRPSLSMAYCYLMLDDAETANKFFQVVKKYNPNAEWIKEGEKTFEEALINKQYIEHFAWLVQFLKDKDATKIPVIFNTIPTEYRSNEVLARLKNISLPPNVWDKKSVVIFCGQAWEDWSPTSVISGIGGSEEAVIYLSQELAKIGWNVTVFNSCGDMEGEYDGVTYRPYYEFNPLDTFNVLVSWRNNIFNYYSLIANKKLLWLHDVPYEEQIKKGINLDKIFVLSQFHKSLLKDVPEEKICVSANGINLKDFEVNLQERNPKRMIYTSSYDRGIEYLLERWEDVRKEVPEAELHLFYGWDTYNKMLEKGARSPEFKDRMVKLMSQEGIVEHGRIGHKELVKELQKSWFWVYPSHFEEISCISAMKAQSAGCYPVCTDYAALKETVKGGAIITGSCRNEAVLDNYIKMLVSCLKSNPVINIDKNQFGWDKVAQQWTEVFNESTILK